MKPFDEWLFTRMVPVTESGCWLWTGAIATNGYGRTNYGGTNKQFAAHRIVYEHFKGKIPNGLTIDHLCNTKSCVNPDHLEAVTQKVNWYRGKRGKARIGFRQTHCKRGHRFTEDNIYIDGRGNRTCYACKLAVSQAHYYRKKEATNALRNPAQ